MKALNHRSGVALNRVIAFAVAIACASACGGSADDSGAGGARDAGVLDSLIGPPDASVADATRDGETPLDAPRFDAPPQDAPSQDAPPGARVCDSLDAGPDAPPPYCVPPCLWEAISRCMPVLDACLLDEPQPGLATSCDPQSGWSLTRGSLDDSGTSAASGFYEVRHNGELCYGVSYSENYHVAQYSGPDGPIGFSLDSPGLGSTVFCTTYPLSEVIRWVRTPIGTPSCGLRRDRPECAAWNDYGYPVGTGCASTTPGSCGDGGTP